MNKFQLSKCLSFIEKVIITVRCIFFAPFIVLMPKPVCFFFKKSINWRTHKDDSVIHREISKTFYQSDMPCGRTFVNQSPVHFKLKQETKPVTHAGTLTHAYTGISSWQFPGSVSQGPVNKPYSRDLTAILC